MVQACENADVPFMVHENFRWQSPMRALKVAAADIGDLFFGRISFRTPYDVYANQPYLATEPRFIIADLGVHLLDLARFFFGEVEQLTCHTQSVNPRIVGEDVATILLKMRSGATCLVDCSYATKSAEDPFPQTLVHLEGTKGRARLGAIIRLTWTRDAKEHSPCAAPDVCLEYAALRGRAGERRCHSASLDRMPANWNYAGNQRRGQPAHPGTRVRRIPVRRAKCSLIDIEETA